MARIKIVGTSKNDKLDERRNGESDIFGKAGNDTIRLLRADDLGGNNTVDAGPGKDKVLNQFEGGNIIKLGSGNDLYIGNGFTAFNNFDIVRGGSGNDKIFARTRQSRYFGDSGNDTFFSEGNGNAFNGGAGTDTIDYSIRADSNTSSNQAVTVRLNEQKAFTGPIKTEALFGIENATGTLQNDILSGDDGPNILKGLDGDDALNGFGGDDQLVGGPGSDFIAGDGGNDQLTGNDGPDGFLFQVLPLPIHADVITDFNTAEDVIGLSTEAFPGLATGVIDASRLTTGPSATNPNHRVIYDSITGRVFFDSDGSGIGQAQLIVTIPANLNITPPNIEIL